MKDALAKLLKALIGVVALVGLLLGNGLTAQAAPFSEPSSMIASPMAIVAEGEATEISAEPAKIPEEIASDLSEAPAPAPEAVTEPITEPTTKPITEPTTKPITKSSVPEETVNLLKQLETEILPQIESVLTPEQQVEFATRVAAGTSFRKAFKAVTLTPAQKKKLSTVFKSIPKKDIFATLTPAQKKELFIKNKQLFIPTSAEIGAKINAGMQMGKDKSKSPSALSSDEIVDKISAKRKAIGLEE